MPTLCPDQELSEYLELAKRDPAAQEGALKRLIDLFPDDGRLHFLLGANLVGAGRLIEGRIHLVRAVELAPDFSIARFQLGFFELTSGEAEAALRTWARLDLLNESHYLRWFVDGLRALIRDEFDVAVAKLRHGIEINDENPPLNRDMHLLIERMSTPLQQDVSEETSETELVLRQFGARIRES